MAPIGRILAQIIVPIVATLARALPAAYAQAVQNAKKGGAQAAKDSANVFGKSKMSREEALDILNVVSKTGSKPPTPELIQQQFDKYFEANKVEKGGSFYLQSKIYRAKEMLDEYQTEKRMEEQESSTGTGQAEQTNEQKKEEQ